MDTAADIPRLEFHDERSTLRPFVHGDAAQHIATPFDQSEHAQKCAFGRIELDDQTVVHQPFSNIWTFELFGGTSGQTFSRGSIRTWHRIGPSVLRSRRIAPSTCDR